MSRSILVSATFLGVVFTWTSILQSATIDVELVDLVGNYELPGDRRAASFDLEPEFASIDEMILELTVADASRGGACTTGIPERCTVGTILNYHIADPLHELDDLDRSSLSYESCQDLVCGSWFGLRPDHENQTKVLPPGGRLTDDRRMVFDPWPSFLLEGRGEIELELIGHQGTRVLGTGYHRVEVLSARLIVEGTLVPEPTSIALSICALLAIGVRRRSLGLIG